MSSTNDTTEESAHNEPQRDEDKKDTRDAGNKPPVPDAIAGIRAARQRTIRVGEFTGKNVAAGTLQGLAKGIFSRLGERLVDNFDKILDRVKDILDMFN